MKNILFALTAMIVMAACGNKQAVAPAESGENSNEVAFEVAKNYFFKNNQEIPSSPKITTSEEFGKLFGMATTMGKEGKPTEIDFTTMSTNRSDMMCCGHSFAVTVSQPPCIRTMAGQQRN